MTYHDDFTLSAALLEQPSTQGLGALSGSLEVFYGSSRRDIPESGSQIICGLT